MNKILSILGLVLLAVSGGCTRPQCVHVSQTDEKIILQTIHDQKFEYIYDGTCDTYWMYLPAIQNIISEYRSKLVPALINNLDNNAPSEVILVEIDKQGQRNPQKTLTMGCVCFDLLCGMIRDDHFWWPDDDCSSDGFWECVRPDLRIDLDASEASMKAAKIRWIKGYQDGKVDFSENWKGLSDSKEQLKLYFERQ